MSLRNSSREPINWVAVRQRLAAAMEAMDSLLNPAPEKRQQMLEAQAAALAARTAATDEPAALTGVVSFALSDMRFAIETRYICGVFPLGRIRPLPRTPDHVLGLHDLQGQLLPVFDPRGPLGIAQNAPPPRKWAIACGENQPEFLIVIDAVSNVANLPGGSLPDRDAKGSWIRGETADGAALLDGAAILNDRRFFLDDREDAPSPAEEGGP